MISLRHPAMIAAVSALALMAAACSQTASDTATPATSATPEGSSGGPKGGAGGIDKSGDAALQTMIKDVLPRFSQFTYKDAESGLTIPYSLYVPEGAAKGAKLPMVTFIADASTVGDDVLTPLKQGWGGLIWATEAEQAKHPAIVLVPSYPEVTIDDHDGLTATPYIAATQRMIAAIAKERGADTNRLYATGQSMGCMMFLLMSAEHPDMFAGQMFVSGQWDTARLAPLAQDHFIYTASAGDAKASAGQAELKKAFTDKGVSYAEGTLDGKASEAEQQAAAQAVLAKGKAINFLTFKAASVLPAGATDPGPAGDHMYSFDPAYRLAPLRDWLFAQKKD